MKKVLALDSNGFQEEVKLEPATIGDIVLATPLTNLVAGLDKSDLTSLNTILEAFIKLQTQVHSKDTILKVEYLTGTTVLSEAQNAAIIDSFADCNIFLPPGVDNLKYRLRNVGTGKVTFIPNGFDTIEKSSFYVLLTNNAFDLVFLNGNWFLF
jgi:hypothetical protein